jgi:sarcosine oxidase subunit delta
MLIRCPWCGERPFSEFEYGGDASIARPDAPERVSDTDWLSYLYLRQNPRGIHRELWFHEYGCEQWLEVMRDTLTHGISAVAPAAQSGRSA